MIVEPDTIPTRIPDMLLIIGLTAILTGYFITSRRSSMPLEAGGYHILLAQFVQQRGAQGADHHRRPRCANHP